MSELLEHSHDTSDDVLAMSDDQMCELVDGERVEKNMGAISIEVSCVILNILRAFCHAQRLGRVLMEAPFQCYAEDPKRVRIPDVAFIANGKLPDDKLPRGRIFVVPDLVVEITSLNDLVYDLDRKIAEYFRAGVRQVWVVNPEECVVTVASLSGTGRYLRGEAEISGEDILPGFSCKISEFFKTL